MDRETQWRQQRGTLIGVIASVSFVAAIMAFSFLACGGYALGAIVVILGFMTLGMLHYVLWGRSMSDEVAEERRAEEMRRRLQAEAWPEEDDDEPHQYRRF
jgi:hypothetical protein